MIPPSPAAVDHFEVSGEALQTIIDTKLGPAVEGLPVPHAILAMLTLSVLILSPDIPIEKLQTIVQSQSEALVLSVVPTSGSVN